MHHRIARHFATGRPVKVSWANGSIEQIEELSDDAVDPNLFISPGLIDIQINGYGGINFGDPDLSTDQVRDIARKLFAVGVTQFLPTLITDSTDRMAAALARLAAAAQHSDLAPAIPGIHLEGPYLSPEDGPRGAHPLDHCKLPDWKEFERLQESARGMIKLVTLAPELEGSPEFIEQATAHGIRVAFGHTAATRASILNGVEAGATLATHLGNAAHDQLQRHHNYIYDQLAEDRLYASLIVDGHHLPPHLVKIFWRVKGPQRSILISDAVQYAGLPPGIYDGGYRKFEVREDGFIGVVGEPRMAGSGLMLLRGVENLVRFADATLADSVRCATEIPARFLGMHDRLGRLAAGCEASLLLFEWDRDQCKASVRETVLAGTVV